MRNGSHTVVAIMRLAINTWRRRESWSRETVTQHVVYAFEAADGDRITGLRFDPDTRDAYERTKVNADRLFRWLDDESKENNLLPASMLPFILAALPMDLRIQAAAELLQPAGLAVHVLGDAEGVELIDALQHVAKESGEATSALAGLVDGVEAGELEHVAAELTQAISAQQQALRLVESRIAGNEPAHIRAVKQ